MNGRLNIALTAMRQIQHTTTPRATPMRRLAIGGGADAKEQSARFPQFSDLSPVEAHRVGRGFGVTSAASGARRRRCLSSSALTPKPDAVPARSARLLSGCQLFRLRHSRQHSKDTSVNTAATQVGCAENTARALHIR